jgi:hypothetical protein
MEVSRMDNKISKLLNKLITDSEDLYQLSTLLKNDYFSDEDIDGILEDIRKIKTDISLTVNKIDKLLG